MLMLILAGEAAFLLPFLPARVFRPALLDVFGITNLQLGTAYAVYGGVAMLAYISGGPLADRFGPRTMLVLALLSTAAGGVVLAGKPSFATLTLLYAYWGVTTIALFWAPLIRATREWGDDYAQGKAFGLLDGGRGLLAAATASVMVMVFAALLPAEAGDATLAQRTAALRQAMLVLLAVTLTIALLLWFTLPRANGHKDGTPHRLSVHGIVKVVRLPAVWLQALIILCAYVGFRSIDDFSLYANEVLGRDDVAAADVGTLSLWVRPLAAVTAGFLADRYGSGRLTMLSFALLFAGSTMLASGALAGNYAGLFLLTIACTSLGIFALRGLYFAIMQEARIPWAVTGSAVGFVSLIGYTPDVFMGPLMGYLLDNSPGVAGHRQVFLVVAGFALAGLVASAAFNRFAQAAKNPM